jgi:hypothetical protein
MTFDIILLATTFFATVAIGCFKLGQKHRKTENSFYRFEQEILGLRNELQHRRDWYEQWHNTCRLIDIQRNGRSNFFTFCRGNETFTIETMGLLSDDIAEWRKQAGLFQ